MADLEKYLVLNPDGSMRWISTEHVNMCIAFRDAIGCRWLEHVSLPHGFGCVVDESGLLRDQKFNPLASRFYPGYQFGFPLFGSVVFVRQGFVNGEPDWVELYDKDLRMIELVIGKEVPA